MAPIQSIDNGHSLDSANDITVTARRAKHTALDEEPVATTGTTSQAKEEFKEGGYGWVVVTCVSLINAHTWGLNSSFAIFLAYYLRTGVIEGATPLAFSFVGGLSISFAFLVAPVVTTTLRYLGVRNTVLIGVVFETIGFIGASFASKIWHLLLSQGIAFGIGMGFCFIGTAGVVPQWFIKRRSLANAISTSGSGFGGLTYALATDAMIKNIGLAWAFRVIAIVTFVVNGVSGLLMRDRNTSVGAVLNTFNGRVLRKLEYWLFYSWTFFSVIGYIIAVFSIVDYAQSNGLSAQQGSLVAAFFNLSQGIGRPVIGYMSDPLGRFNVASLATLFATLCTFFLWIFAGKYYAGLIVYAFMGTFAGVVFPTVAPIAAEVVGLSLLQPALSATWLFLVPPSTCAEAIGLSLRRPSGSSSYIDVQVFTGFMYLAAFLSIWLLRSWKIGQQTRAPSKNADSGTTLSKEANTNPLKQLIEHLFTMTTV